MFFAGSEGTVDPGDIAKVSCVGSIVQLGGGGVLPPPGAGSGITEEIPIRSVTATIRYAVTTEVDGNSVSILWLAVRYRPGDGHVVATLLEVPHFAGALLGQDPGTVTETPVLEFDSANFSQPPDTFRTNVAAGLGSTNADHVLDFESSVYYVALSLTAPEIDTALPPAVAAIGVVFNPIGNLPLCSEAHGGSVAMHAGTFLAVISRRTGPRLAAGRKPAMIKGGGQSRVAESA